MPPKRETGSDAGPRKSQRSRKAKMVDSSDGDDKDKEPIRKPETAKPKGRKAATDPEALSGPLYHFRANARPPPTISLATAEPVHLSAEQRDDWESDAGGRRAACRNTEFDIFRLIGSTRISVSGHAADAADKLGMQAKPVKRRESDKKWGWGNRITSIMTPLTSAPMEAWDKTTGEVSGQGFPSAEALLAALYDGDLICEDDWACEFLEALAALTVPDPALWGCPLLRCVITPPEELLTREAEPPPKKSARAGSSSAADESASEDVTLELTLHVYISRLLLYLIAHPSIKLILGRLTPPDGAMPRPVDTLPAYPASFLSHGGAAAPPFSLEGLLKSTEHVGYRELPQVGGLALTLKPYQQQAVAWMVDMEALPRINGLFWEARPFADGGQFHYSPQLGEMRLAAPPVMHGGLLCDEMGLGKTLEVVSLILATLHQPPDDPPNGCLPSRCTLIVVPPTLVMQWMAEIAKSVGEHSTLKYAKYTQTDLLRKDGGGEWKEEAATLAANDILVTTYFALDKCSTLLPGVAWKRVVLDEMQEVRSSTTELARKCERIASPRRWMVSGTPLYDKISDLQGELYFLRVSPFGAGHEDGFWRHVIGQPWEQRQESSLDALHLLLRGVMMRHSKSQTHLDGRSILSLPSKTITYQRVMLDRSELAAYAFLEALLVHEIRRCRALETIGERDTAVVARAANANQAVSGAQLLVKALRMLREACVALQLLSGGAGCHDQLKGLEEICRARLRAACSSNPEMLGRPFPDTQIQRLTASEAIVHLGSSDRVHTERHQGDRFHNAGRADQMVRHSNQTGRVHERSRTYAVDTLKKKLTEAEQKLRELETALAAGQRGAALLRWRWALEQVTTGAALCAARLHVAQDDDDEGALAGLEQAEAEALEADAELKAEAVAAAEEAAAAPREKDKATTRKTARPRNTLTSATLRASSWRFVWLYRGVYAAHRAKMLAAAERTYEECEAAIKSPPLVHLSGDPSGVLRFVPTSRAEAETGLTLLARPHKLIEVRTEDDATFNRELVKGKLRCAADGAWDSLTPLDKRRLVTVDVRNSVDADDGDGHFIQLEETRGVVSWVHNKPRLDAALLYRECQRRGLPTPSLQTIRDDAQCRQQLVKEAFAQPRAALDAARALASSMPAALGAPALDRFARSDAMSSLGGLAVLAEPLRQLRAAQLTSVTELRSKVHAAIVLAASRRGARENAAKLGEELSKDFRALAEKQANVFAPMGWRPTAGVCDALREAHPGWGWLHPHAIRLSRLPSAAQPAEIVAAFRGAVGASSAPAAAELAASSSTEPIVWLATGGVAYVLLGHKNAVERAIELVSKSSGLKLRFAQEDALWEARVAQAREQLQRLELEQETAKKTEASLSDEILAKRVAAGSDAEVRKLEKTAEMKALRKARAEASAVLSKGSEDGGSSMARKVHDARRALERALSGRRAVLSRSEVARTDSMAILVEKLAAPKEEARHKFTSELSAELYDACAEAADAKAQARIKLTELQPYVAKLQAAEARGLHAEVVDQSGFQELFRLERGLPPTSTCPICFDAVGAESPIVVTPCAHLFCRDCMLKWITADDVMRSDAERQGASITTKLCPCCRHHFIQRDIVEIVPQTEEPPAASTSAGAGSSSDPLPPLWEPNDEPLDDKCRYARAYSLKMYERMPPPDGESQVRVGRCPSIPPSLLAHMQAATGLPPGSGARAGGSFQLSGETRDSVADEEGSPESAGRAGAGAPRRRLGRANLPAAQVGSTILPSAKVVRLLLDLEALGEDEHGVPLKAVIFSQHRAAIKHLDLVFAHANIPHVTISKGDAQSSLESAVATWTTRASCRVFLLHAGAAAAGLTLVAAQHVFLLEPFDKPGQELQALNRCHRIGQTRPVRCTIYYAGLTVEERLLAFRELEQRHQPEISAELAQGGEAEAISTLAEGAALPSRQKLRFLFGMMKRARERGSDDADSDDSDDDADEHSGEEDEDEDYDEQQDGAH